MFRCRVASENVGEPCGIVAPAMTSSEEDDRQNKRDTERIEILGELHGEVMVYQPMAIKERSRGGAQVETAYPFQLDSLHDFRLTLGEPSIVIKGPVGHWSRSDVDHGVR